VGSDDSDDRASRTNGHDPSDAVSADGPDDAATVARTDPLRAELRDLDVATMTPIEAMNALADLQDDLDPE